MFLHAFLTWTLNRGEWSASRSGRWTPKERILFNLLNLKLDGSQGQFRSFGEPTNLLPQLGN